MLEIKNISKQYRTGDLVQNALDHVSLNLRENEFVAVLGPSGSGKTTLLNIIGGLDRYDSGDLVINGISTRQYKDRDWDSYRNHTIGFVFQSYNLIPHQTILANVELALTISGISGKERTQKAKQALNEVGLGDQIHKKPNQLSGGQMQRVALARALVNDPDILLADEPTGALDSETSVQVMELLKKVADDRLVVMVTHNPELAEQYATRIVTLKDGVIRSDTDPYIPETKSEPVHRNMGKSSMSFLTALSLSLNNLLTKKARTILVAFAGSIGIIGIALILSLSNGVNDFIQKTEEDTLSEYPITIQKQAFDLSSLMNEGSDIITSSDEEDQVGVINAVSSMFAEMTSNDLKSFKEYLEENAEEVNQYARAVEYVYDVEPQIYQSNTEEGVHQVHPDTLISSSGIMPTSSIYSSSMSSNTFHQLPEDSDLYEDSYDIKAGRWPQNVNEAVLVLSTTGNISDMTLYIMGLRDIDELETIIQNFTSGSSQSDSSSAKQTGTYDYEDFLNVSFKVVLGADYYQYDDSLGMWVSQKSNSSYMKNLVDNGEDLKIVGVVQQKPETDIGMLSTGIYYTSDLQKEIMAVSADKEIVKAQLQDMKTNVLTGEPFAESGENDIDLSKLFSINEDELQNIFSFDTSGLTFDTSAFNNMSIDMSSLAGSFNMPEISESDLTDILSSVEIDTSNVDLVKIMEDLVTDFFNHNSEYLNTGELFNEYINDTSENGALALLQAEVNRWWEEEMQETAKADLQKMSEDLVEAYRQSQYYDPDAPDDFSGYTEFLSSDTARAIYAETAAEILSGSEAELEKLLNVFSEGFKAHGGFTIEEVTDSVETYFSSSAAADVIMSDLMSMLDVQGIENQLAAAAADKLSAYTDSMSGMMESLMTNVMNSIQSGIITSMSGMTSQLENAFSFNTDAFENMISFDMDSSTLSSAFASMLNTTSSSAADNLTAFGYCDTNDPSEILIYPRDFDAKNDLISILDSYNTQMKETGQNDKVIVYTDIVGTMMSSVTDIVNVISYILIAFVAISLVVSSIMIGVITYISVLERQKEIGILRAIGASKRNISNVFNAETFITGLLAGLFGVGITLLLLIPGNMIIHLLTGRTDVTAVLPLNAAGVLILLSVILTIIGGIIPSHKASNSDPVKALRTE